MSFFLAFTATWIRFSAPEKKCQWSILEGEQAKVTKSKDTGWKRNLWKRIKRVSFILQTFSRWQEKLKYLQNKNNSTQLIYSVFRKILKHDKSSLKFKAMKSEISRIWVFPSKVGKGGERKNLPNSCFAARGKETETVAYFGIIFPQYFKTAPVFAKWFRFRTCAGFQKNCVLFYYLEFFFLPRKRSAI